MPAGGSSCDLAVVGEPLIDVRLLGGRQCQDADACQSRRHVENLGELGEAEGPAQRVDELIKRDEPACGCLVGVAFAATGDTCASVAVGGALRLVVVSVDELVREDAAAFNARQSL